MKNGMRILLSAAALSRFFLVSAAAQLPKAVPKLSLSYQVISSKAKKDSSILLARIELPPGWHINSETPPDSFLVPTRLEVEAKDMEFGKPEFPAPEMVFSAAMGEKLPLHTGIFTIKVPARKSTVRPTGTSVTANTYPATKATLHYQACNDSMCLPPKDITAELAAGVAGK